MQRATWDGLPVSREKSHGASVVVWRDIDGEREFLLLHRRAPGGADFDGDWAWTPPAGARLPGESIDETARRELREETGLELRCRATGPGEEEWAVYVAHASARAGVTLDEEHDRFAWLPIAQAAARCAPAVVREGLERAAAWLESRAPR
ncbi:MAG: NUDIX domain-containing protein [Gaiellaceae bacterium]